VPAAVSAAAVRRARAPLRGLPPVWDARIETLILGSFPGVASLARGQYYAHPRNQFWRLVGAALGVPLPEQDYPQRLRTLLAHRIGLWDVVGRCTRSGSLDSSIRDARGNSFEPIFAGAPRLARVYFNGRTAARAQPLFEARGYRSVLLPSSSPAYTLTFEAKRRAWAVLGDDRAAGRCGGTSAC
jgi:hypoxanthine-DNA glycosylase